MELKLLLQKLFLNLDSARRAFREVLKASGNYKKSLVRSISYSFFSSVLLGLMLLALYPLFNAIQASDTQRLLWWLVIFSIIGLTSLLFKWLSLDYDFEGKSLEAASELRLILGEKLKEVPLEVIYQKRAGEFNAIFLSHVEEAVGYSASILSSVIFATGVPLVVIAGMLWIDIRIALILLGIFPLSFMLYLWRRPAFQRGFTYLARAVEQMNSELVELIQGIAVIRSSCTISKNLNQYQTFCERVRTIQYIGQKKGGKPNLIILSTVELGLYVAIAMGTLWVLTGSLSATVIVTALVIFVRFNEMFSTLVLFAAAVEVLAIGYKSIEELLNLPSQESPESLSLSPVDYSVSYQHVSFYYKNSNQAVLNNLSVEFPAQSMTAIVGASGCGKSTLVRLLMRFSDPQEGVIKIGGIDIRNFPLEQLMRLITIVFQDVYLFNDTVYNNICFGNEGASPEEVYEAAKMAHCHEFITQLPDGYATMVKDNGNNFSGGEKQRISIARSLLKKAPIVVLDEPTAALDIENELAVQAAIEALIKEKTVIVISHRLTTTKGADKILVLDKGRLVEIGTHAQLLEAKGHYANFWNLQDSVRELAFSTRQA